MSTNHPKSAILLVAFGTSIASAKASYQNIENKVKASFPNIDVTWSYTSPTIRRKLQQSSQTVLSPLSALAKMADEGYTHIAVQSLHIIPGIEYSELKQMAQSLSSFSKGLQKVTVGCPLLYSHTDMQRVAQEMAKVAHSIKQNNEAVLLMGHGTPHPANVYYPAMQQYLQHLDTNIYLGTVEGYPTFEETMAQMIRNGVTKTWLVPFMNVAGDHATKDMTGPGDDTWEKQLNRNGIATSTLMQGLGEMDAMVGLWIEHLHTAVNELY